MKKAWFLLPVVVAAGIFAWLAASQRADPQAGRDPAASTVRPRSALLITLDTMRADRLGAYGYSSARTPNLDALARRGVRFDDATAPAPITGPSHAAILTGMLPGRLSVFDNATTALPESASTIAEVLSPKGFATGAFVGAFILDRPYGFAQGFDTFESGFSRVDSGTEANTERPANEVVDEALAWLSSVPGDLPFFGWVHLYDAHVRYSPPAPFSPDYDGEVAFVDQQVGRLLAALRARGTMDSTLVIAIGDHGESLGEHGEDEHGVFLYDAVLRIPFIATGPGVKAGHVVAEQVRALDVVPTILDLLGIAVPQGSDGVSLKPLLEGGTRTQIPPSYAESLYPKLHFGWSDLRAIRADGWKAIDAPKPELYNLREDPREQNNLYASQRALADRMIADASRLGRELTAKTSVAAPQPDPETLERLRSLGYVGTSAAKPGGVRGPDPKDHINERREYNTLIAEAIDDLRGGRPESAVPKFQRLIRINERAYDLHLFLGEAYERLGQREPALGEYEYAALLNPKSVIPLVAAAQLHLRLGDVGSARERHRQAVAVQPQAYEVLVLSARILEMDARPREALTIYERAVTRNPVNPRARIEIVRLATQFGRWDVAERHLRQLLEMSYQPARTHFALGRVAQAQGRTDDAASNYREALRLDPSLVMAQEELRALEGKNGDIRR
jgi:arylsulfatase A-like enzyme/Tfp pilus assembly protein PilF